MASPSSTPRLAAGIGHDGSSRTRHRPHRPSAQATCRRRATARRLHRSRRPRGRFPRRRAAHLLLTVGRQPRPARAPPHGDDPTVRAGAYPAVTRAEVLRAQRFSKAWPMGARAGFTYRCQPSRTVRYGGPQGPALTRRCAGCTAGGSECVLPEARRRYQRGWIAKRRAEFFADKTCIDRGTTKHLELDAATPPSRSTTACGRGRPRGAKPSSRSTTSGSSCRRTRFADHQMRHGMPAATSRAVAATRPRGQVAPQRAVPRAAPRGDCRKTARTSEQAAGGVYGVRDRRWLSSPTSPEQGHGVRRSA